MQTQSLVRNNPNFPITAQQWFKELDYIGNIELLNWPLLAIFSSAKCPAGLILKAHDFAKELRNEDKGIISGFHAPAEKEVLEVLLKGTCPIIVVLGRKLNSAGIPVVWRREIEKGRMLITSSIKTDQSYITKRMALQRNDLAARIAGHVLTIYAREGGTLEKQVSTWKASGIEIEYL